MKKIGINCLISLLVIACFIAGTAIAKRARPGAQSGPSTQQVSYFYRESVLREIEPPDWKHSLIRISVQGAAKVDLWTDGDRFRLWTAAPTLGDVDRFLSDLAQSSRVPNEPTDAAALMKVKWEGTDLSSAQFSQINEQLTSVLLQYISSAKARYKSLMETKLGVVYLDASGFRVTYDNTHEHLEVWVWNDPREEQDKTLLDWIHGLQKLAEDSFHHPIRAPDPR